MKGEETEKDGNDTWEQQHFYLQLVRIPKNNQLSLLRLCQIAYNIGQYKATLSDGIYSEIAIKYFDDNNMDDINTYVIYA